jgi:hypothetical protein
MNDTRQSENGQAIGLAVESWFGVLSLDQLCKQLSARFGDEFEITQREHGDGTSEAILEVDGALRASWRGRLKNAPVYDGTTPRGPKEYYDLQFFQPNAKDQPHAEQ